MKVMVAPSNWSEYSNEENVPEAVNYVKPPSKKPFIIYNLLYTLKKDKRFALNKMLQKTILKFSTFYVYFINTGVFFVSSILKKIHKYMTKLFHLL